MEYISRNFDVLTLHELVEVLCSGQPRRPVIAVTFDDGYVDLLQNALPVLASEQIPATLFISGAHIGSQREFWWDNLERVFSVAEDLPAELSLTMGGRRYTWKDLRSFETRKTTFWTVYRLIKSLRAEERRDVVDYLIIWAGLKRDARPEYRVMNSHELMELTRSSLIEIGSHTLTHAALASLPEEVQRFEIVSGRDILERILKRPIQAFAYPYGCEDDFTNNTVEIVRTEGFSFACTMVGGSIQAGDDPLTLRRCTVNDWDLGDFKEQLKAYLSS